MPEYEYRCPVCGNRQEHSHGIKAEPDVRCERKAAGARCGAKMTRVVTGGGAVLFPMSSRVKGVT